MLKKSLLLIAALLLPLACAPYDTSTWTQVGSMSSPRAGHTATLLSNGRVLVAGGRQLRTGEWATAEVYDPETGTWSETGSMSSPREGHTATRLPDGKVLVTGGTDDTNNDLATAEVYDPEKGTWSATSPMSSPRARHRATLLPDGKVLVTGGVYDGRHSTGTAEVYDPAKGTWNPTGSMAPRLEHAATLLSNDKVLVTGGFTVSDDHSGVLATAEVYDPETGTWSATASMSSPRVAHLATLLSDGTVLITAGQDGHPEGGFGSVVAMAEVYDPVSGTWSPAGASSFRSACTATLLNNGEVLLTGGTYGGAASLRTAQIYEPVNRFWSVSSSMSSGRYLHTATLLPGGKVLVVGGYNYDNSGTRVEATAEVYTP